ncbi:EaE protein [Enterobacter phage Mulvp2]|nr:EaE protein [Enterobacter phage Mulvp2]
MIIKDLVTNIKRNGLLTSMHQLEELYKIAIENEEMLAASQREFRAADATIENLQMQVEKLAANAEGCKWDGEQWVGISIETPATDAFLAEVRAQGVEMFGQYHNFSEKLFIQKEAKKFATKLRREAAQ